MFKARPVGAEGLVRTPGLHLSPSLSERPAPPALPAADGAEAFERVPGLCSVDPQQVREDHLCVLEAALAPGAEAEPVERPVEWPVVDEAPWKDAGEAVGEGLLADRDAGVVELDGGLRALRVQGEVAEMHPGVDAALVPLDETVQDAARLADASEAVQLGRVGNGVEVPPRAPRRG